MTAETAGEAGSTVDEAVTPLHRSRTDRVLAGVCGGIAETYGADPTAVRLLAAIIGDLHRHRADAGPLPGRRRDRPRVDRRGGLGANRRTRSRIEPGQGALIFGIVLIVAGVAALANELFHIDWELLWPAALIAFGGPCRPARDATGAGADGHARMTRAVPAHSTTRATGWVRDPRLPGASWSSSRPRSS